MHLIYLIAAAVGCTLVGVQVVLQLTGLGAETGDAGHLGDLDTSPGESNLFFGVLSFKTLSAFTAFFGLAGLAAAQMKIESEGLILLISLLSGVSAAALVMLLMRMLVGLQSSGTIELKDAVGLTARVYLRVPGQMGGRGKITVVLGGRELQVGAVTPGDEVPTGAMVEVTRLVEGNTFEIIRL